MLVITRRLNESILVGDNIRIVVLGIDGDRIKIGIEAPASLKILRTELLAEVRDVNREATAANLTSLASLQGMLCPEVATETATVSGSANKDNSERQIGIF